MMPWESTKSANAFRRQMKRLNADLRERDPRLMKRLRKLTDAQLDALELLLLETAAVIAPSPAIKDQIRI
jgi:hypothetical protein